MTDGKISRVPISEIHSEEGAQDLVRSERMKPYLRAGYRTVSGCISRTAAGRAVRMASDVRSEVGFL
jgi:hypothetical protein